VRIQLKSSPLAASFAAIAYTTTEAKQLTLAVPETNGNQNKQVYLRGLLKHLAQVHQPRHRILVILKCAPSLARRAALFPVHDQSRPRSPGLEHHR
jgi:hypothetical protein